jgi:hypothetical protein
MKQVGAAGRLPLPPRAGVFQPRRLHYQRRHMIAALSVEEAPFKQPVDFVRSMD